MQQTHSIPVPPSRPIDGHKGTFGTVVVMGGCPRMPGAAAIVARAALRAGVGLVKIATDEQTLPIVLSIEPCATGADDASLPADAVYAVGPGWGPSPSSSDDGFFRIPAGARRVIDADGLNRLAEQQSMAGAKLGFDGPTVLTPHPGEYRRLAEAFGLVADPVNPDDRPRAARLLAEVTGAVVLLKGARTIVTDGERAYTNQTGTPAMATAGSGDVLTGLIAGLIAQGMLGYEAACLGAYAHGLAGEAWARKNGPAGLRAIELADLLPMTLNEIRNKASS